VILDSSAILAVILTEPGYERILRRVYDAPIAAVGAPTVLEAAMVLSSRLGLDARPILNEFLRAAEVEVISFTRDHYEVAVDAFQRYGKGRHPARLNFGDSLTYAVARVSGAPLLFTGDDFSKTDLAEP
jgi:ribonuclease VapC